MMSLRNMIRGLENDSVARRLLQLWQHDTDTLKFWRASSNFIYVFEINRVRHFLRFVHEEDNDPANIQAELDFMRYLAAAGYPAVSPVLSRHGNWMETLRTDDCGRYYGVVFEQAPGAHLSLDEMTDRQAAAWGESLSSMHLLSESYRFGPTARGSWRDALTFVASVLERHPDERVAGRALAQVLGQLSELPAGAEHVGLIHYDFEIDNLCYDERKARFSVIDFDDAMVHWYAMDIVSAVADLAEQEDPEARRKIAHFLTGYRSKRPLDERWVQEFPLLRRFADLYALARLLRSVENMDARHAPAWAVQLRDKLLRACDTRRERLLPPIALRPVDHSNWYACTQLEVTAEQAQVFPVPAVYWLAESAYCGYTPLAVYADEQPVGLAIYAVDPDDGSYWIMAFMIDRRFQQRGLGRAGMKKLIGHMKEKYACDRILLGHRPENRRAAGLYASLGFAETGRDEREVIRLLKLPTS